MILVLSYIGLMLMLCSRPMYGHLNENFFSSRLSGWKFLYIMPRFLMSLEN